MSRADDTVEVTNQFDNAALNYYGVDFTYLSRSDWSGTYPASVVSIDATDEMIDDLNLDWYETPADAPAVSDFTQGADNGLKFIDMRLVEWNDDEQWDAFLDQLTKHQGIDSACNTVIDSLPDEFRHAYITAMAGSVILNPRTGCCFQTAFQHTQDFTDRDLICRLAKLVSAVSPSAAHYKTGLHKLGLTLIEVACGTSLSLRNTL